ncbi:ribonuclease H-like domain-containing protein [Tanacetum coccineum]
MFKSTERLKVLGTEPNNKARLVANGRSQQFGVDCDDTFSPVVKPATVRTVLSLALSQNWPIHQLDVKNSFLNNDLSKTMYMYQPLGSLVAYTDADWAGCPTIKRSTSGYCVYLGDNILSLSAKRQHTLSRSSAKAEYRGVANVVAKTVWLRNLLRELHTPLLSATIVYCDNVSAIYMTASLVQHQRTKHIEIDIHFVHDMVARGQVRVHHVPSRYQYADIFTKGLPSALFEELCTSFSVRPSPAQTVGAY